jgi:hypothetical protein
MIEWTQITAAIGLALSGEREGGHREMAQCWDGLGPDDHAKRCVLAHYLADVQANLVDEVSWDEQALAEFTFVRDEDLLAVGIPSAAGLAPSLHLNLGDAYLRQGRVGDAQREVALGLAASSALSGDGYATMIRTGLDRLKARAGEQA